MPPLPQLQHSDRADQPLGGSWLALLAATSLGIQQFEQVRLRVSTNVSVADEAGELRLVVQIFDAADVREDGTLTGWARPRGAAEQPIRGDELRFGASVDVVDLSERPPEGQRQVVAWIERGAADGELDGFSRRPPIGTLATPLRSQVADAGGLPAIVIRP